MLKVGDQDISSDFEMSRLYGCRWNVVYARSQVSDGMLDTPIIVCLCLCTLISIMHFLSRY